MIHEKREYFEGKTKEEKMAIEIERLESLRGQMKNAKQTKVWSNITEDDNFEISITTPY